jgi:hypothetical protein
MGTHSQKYLTYSAYFTLIVISAILVHSHTPFGAAVSMDSLNYLNAARLIAQGLGISLPDYNLDSGDAVPMTLWPPLYPALLSAAIPTDRLFDVEIGQHVAWLNILSLFCTIWLFWWISGTFIHKGLALGLTIMFAFLPSLQIIYLYIWSETVFIPLVLAAFLLQMRFFGTTSRYRPLWLWASVAVLALAFYVRYAGLGFFGALLGSLLLVDRSSNREKFILLARSAILFLLLIAPLLWRNYWVGNYLVGQRDNSSAVLGDDLVTLGNLLAAELLPFGFILLLPALGFVGYLETVH